MAADDADAVLYAESIVADAQPGQMSVPVRRLANLALCFLEKRYPYQCCGKYMRVGADAWRDARCKDCPSRNYEHPDV